MRTITQIVIKLTATVALIVVNIVMIIIVLK